MATHKQCDICLLARFELYQSSSFVCHSKAKLPHLIHCSTPNKQVSRKDSVCVSIISSWRVCNTIFRDMLSHSTIHVFLWVSCVLCATVSEFEDFLLKWNYFPYLTLIIRDKVDCSFVRWHTPRLGWHRNYKKYIVLQKFYLLQSLSLLLLLPFIASCNLLFTENLIKAFRCLLADCKAMCVLHNYNRSEYLYI